MTKKEIFAKYQSEDNTLCVAGLVGADTPTADILDVLASRLDETCSNGHFSRWTLHGSILYWQGRRLVEELEALGL